MKKNKLGITEGEVSINDPFVTEVWSKDTKIASCNNEINSSIYRVKTDEEMKSNANLIADAFNTANKCGLMPSELLEQNQLLIDAIIQIRAIGGFGLQKDIAQLIYDTINQIEQ